MNYSKLLSLFVLLLFSTVIEAQVGVDTGKKIPTEIQQLHYQQQKLMEMSRLKNVGEELSWVQFQLGQWYGGELVRHRIIISQDGYTHYFPYSKTNDDFVGYTGRDTMILVPQPINYEEFMNWRVRQLVPTKN